MPNLLKSYSDQQFHFAVFILALVIYMLTAYQSSGYYHADEHYQIVEFAGFKLGTHAPSDLTWEFHNKMRSAIQPTIATASFSALHIIGVTDPYYQTFFLRLLSVVLALLVIRYFVQSLAHTVDKPYKRAFYVLSYLLWFIPFLSSRFSSEVWAGLSFLMAVALLHNENTNAYRVLKVGLVLGLAFLFRYQTVILSTFLIIWWMVYQKPNWKEIIQVLLGAIAVLIVGILLDSWFYESFVFAPWNYFKINVIEDGASSFGQQSWYYYLYGIILSPSIPLGLIILFLLVFLSIQKYKSFLIWCFVPFIILHSFIPHKESRFLFPLAFLLPYLMVWGTQETVKVVKGERIFNRLKRKFLFIFFVLNALGVVVLFSKPAGVGRMGITEYIHKNYGDEPVQLYFAPSSDPYSPWESVASKFYQKTNIEEIALNNKQQPNEYGAQLIVVNHEYYEVNKVWLKKQVLLKRSVPQWISELNVFYRGFNEKNVLYLYRVD